MISRSPMTRTSKRMINFQGTSDTTDIFVLMEVVAPDVTNMPTSRSSQTTLSEAGVLVDAPPNDTTNVDAGIGIPTVVPALAPVGSNDEKLTIAAQQWQNNITGIGQRFNSVHEFCEALYKCAIEHQFVFKYETNDSHRATVKCKAEGCAWRIHASRFSTTQSICIKKMNATHACEGDAVTTGYQETRSWVAGIIKEKLKVNPNYKLKDIVNDIKLEYGIQLNYFQAWRGKEVSKEKLHGSYRPEQKDSSQNVVIVTPPTRRPPGWPTTKSFGSQEVVKRQLQCRRCKSAGHTKSSCKEFLSEY
ncbi:hypothetical protein Acr_06g0010540 [Actinidia rufa]|uniref:Transposase MuDR plant domain-containing protein n=1 Tax=Actinidia rufa TaxID=165716 RepID=A0A7J0ERJ2_9ERIC|nr:hypothetical protein Acr_06g0010540 [Actinidia rufa]